MEKVEQSEFDEEFHSLDLECDIQEYYPELEAEMETKLNLDLFERHTR